MIMTKKIIVIIGLLMFGCQTKQSDDLFKSAILSEAFSENEISDLKKVMKFFDDEIKLSFSSESLINSYSVFFKKSKEMMNEGQLYINISSSKQDSLFDNLNDNTINKIWVKGKRYNEKDTTEIISLDINSKYIQFLRSLSKKNNLIQGYVNQLIVAGDISPNKSFFFIQNFDSLNFNSEELRLIMAIHYLTLNNQFEE